MDNQNIQDSNLAQIKQFPDKNLFCIEYPGIVNNSEKAIATLGGPQKLSQIVNNPTESAIELNFDPEHADISPILGEPVSTKNLLLKISRKVKKYSDGTIEELDDEYNNWNVNVVGLVDKTIRFRGLSNLQYSLKPNDEIFDFVNKSKTLEGISGDYLLNVADKIKNSYNKNTSIPLPITIPSNFPLLYNYKQSAVMKETLVNKNNVLVPVVELLQKNSSTKYEIIKATFEQPEYPKVHPGGPEIHPEFPNMELYKFFKFEEKPIWFRSSLEALIPPEISDNIDIRRACFSKVAFYMDSGPWKDLWIKFGYNPLSTKKSYIYQSINVRKPILKEQDIAKTELTTGAVLTNRKANLDILENQINSEVNGETLNIFNDDQSEMTENVDNQTVTKSRYHIDLLGSEYGIVFGTMQLCDIKVKKIEKILQYPEILQDSCTKKSGWIRNSVLEHIKLLIKEILEKALEKDIALKNTMNARSLAQLNSQNINTKEIDVESLFNSNTFNENEPTLTLNDTDNEDE
ncbi:hypothetical protein BB559_006161 [Furculomyces boomerangus]|uniref:Transcription factor IIIC subunit 5 HTH domain-containing protein n=2 Tax=Harpellales TaxID=61421 RepID=A0A2T9Y4C4_9FUNG|nr:hypothetical protein BB559_006161 [Furculomyces boomerangus]PWA03202.1 hypothetical protein BB558_000634 [Smittium angustum]